MLLYREELKSFVSNGTLSELHVCFSRDQTDGVDPRYVQDNIRNYAPQLAELIYERNAVIYVCGDASGMSKDVQVAIQDCLLQNTGKKIV